MAENHPTHFGVWLLGHPLIEQAIIPNDEAEIALFFNVPAEYARNFRARHYCCVNEILGGTPAQIDDLEIRAERSEIVIAQAGVTLRRYKSDFTGGLFDWVSRAMVKYEE